MPKLHKLKVAGTALAMLLIAAIILFLVQSDFLDTMSQSQSDVLSSSVSVMIYGAIMKLKSLEYYRAPPGEDDLDAII